MFQNYSWFALVHNTEAKSWTEEDRGMNDAFKNNLERSGYSLNFKNCCNGSLAQMSNNFT